MSDTLYIETTPNALPALEKWLTANIPNTTHEFGKHPRLVEGSVQNGEGLVRGHYGLKITFHEDDRVLFDMRYAGQFDIGKDGWWCDKAISAENRMFAKTFAAHTAAVAAHLSALQAQTMDMQTRYADIVASVSSPPRKPQPAFMASGKFHNPDAQIRKFVR